MQERALLHADIHERGLHAWQDRADHSLVDVPDYPPAFAALDEDLHELMVLEYRDTRLAGGYVDYDFLIHTAPLYSECMAGRAASPHVVCFKV